jgi:hypothetical protein
VENGALEADRVIMCRVAPSAGGDSGWHVRCTVDEEFSGHHVPMTALVSLRPHLLKVVTLPKGWNVHVDGTEIVRILDTERNTRFPPPDGGAG